MKKLYKVTDYTSVVKYLTVFFTFLIFNNLETSFFPYSVAIYSTCVFYACNVFALTPVFLLAVFISGGKTMLAPMAILCAFFIFVRLLYKKTDTKIKFSTPFFTLLGMIAFIILGDSQVFISYEKRILVTLISCFLTLVFTITVNAVDKKGLKYKMNFEELLSITAVTVLFGIGASRFIMPELWKGVAVFITLLVSFLFRFGTAPIISCVLGAGLAVYYGNIEYFSVGLVWGLTADVCMNFSRYLSAISLLVADYLIFTLFGVVGVYTLSDFLPVLVSAVVFCVLPNKPLTSLKERLYAFREKHLVRQSINRNRLMLSNKLYEIAGVFSEISSAFSAFKKTQAGKEKAVKAMGDEVKNSICANCENYMRCKKNEKEIAVQITKMIEIGIAKGKLSLIDLPVSIADKCSKSTDIIFALNKMLSGYKNYMQNTLNLNTGRELIATETMGVAEILKGLALEEGAQLKYQNRLERTLSSALQKSGFIVSELLIYGEEENVNICLILCMKEFSLKQLLNVIRETTNIDVDLVDKNNVTDEKCYLSFKRSAPRDAVFGIAGAVKDGSNASGDTHSVIRINEDKFLVALSDGMGSGTEAKNVSSVSLSLIESFYKAGMSSELILSTVNKLLSVNTDDSFTALDISVIDLNNGNADFIKYGSPYGFIINDNGVKIIEANTLPLGILEDLKPSVCSTTLEDGDMVLLLTDGITDAFKSSGEIIDFLRKIPAKNPQSLADDVLEKAVSMQDGKKNDDMTALAVRVFNKNKTA